MKRALLFLLIIIILPSSAMCAPKKMLPSTEGNDNLLPNIFIYTIPDDNKKQPEQEDKDAPESAYITPKEDAEPEILLEEPEDEIALGATVLKGYAQYVEDANVIHLKDDNDEFVLNIKTPQRIDSSNGLNFGVPTDKPAFRYKDEEYLIAPNKVTASSKIGNFTIGAQYNNEIDNIAMLETETGLFTKYEKNRFALSSSVTRSLNTTYSSDYNTVSITPELKINKYLALKNTFSADVTRNKRSSKLVFLINPFGHKNSDRLFFEFGAKETYNMETETMSTQFSFSTQFKL